ncbi:MAG: hypothetical protein AB1782_01185, partial [Cyanobacteriota bacterium]
MTHEYVHTLEDKEKVEFYFNKVTSILKSQPYGYDRFPGSYSLKDAEPVLLQCDSYDEINSTIL